MRGSCYRDSGADRHIIDMVWLYSQNTHRVAMVPFWRTFHHDGKISPAWWGYGGARPPTFTIFTITLSKTTANWASCFEQLCSTFLSLYFGVKIVNNCRHIGTYRDGIFKLLRGPGIDSMELVAWRASATTPFLLGRNCSKIPADCLRKYQVAKSRNLSTRDSFSPHALCDYMHQRSKGYPIL